MKLCKDCKHLMPDKSWTIQEFAIEHAKCAIVQHPVTGEPDVRCEQFRSARFPFNRIFGLCGREAKFFEPRPTSEVGG